MTSNALVRDLESFRRELTGHSYRMLGSAAEADDAVQETMLRAWRSLDTFESRATLRTWLYRIATNVCLDALAERKRRGRPMDHRPPGGADDPFDPRERSHWLEPIADAAAIPDDVDPHQLAVLRQSIRLAFVAALQHLPARQRAALLLTDVVGLSAAEAAETLGMSLASVNSALQRARATLAARDVATPAPVAREQSAIVDRYVDAFERFDLEVLTSLLKSDATFSMPPISLWLRGPDAVRAFLRGRGAGCRGSRLVPFAANAAPSFAHYKPDPAGGFAAWALIVLETDDDRIAEWNSFLDVETLFPRFGLPLRLAR